MSLLTVVQAVCERAGVPIPTAVVGSLDQNVQQMRGLLEELGQGLAADGYPYQALKRTAAWTATAAEDQGSLTTLTGADFNYILNKTFWNFTLQKPVWGPLSDEEWQYYKAFAPAGPYYQYRIAGDRILITPTPAAGESYRFLWMSKNWIASSDGTTKRSTFAEDSDICLFPEDIMKIGLRARWAAKKGLPYADILSEYDSLLRTYKMRDGTKGTLSLDRSENRIRPGIFVPSGNWPL